MYCRKSTFVLRDMVNMEPGEEEPWRRGMNMGKHDSSRPPAQVDDYDYYPSEIPSTDWAYVSTRQLLVSLPYAHGGQLPPDSNGNTIPSDATWTRIDRRCISVEMLQKAGVRYEARETFVAILGAVTSAQIAELMEHSTAIRQHRRSTRAAAAFQSDEDVNGSSRPKRRNKERLKDQHERGFMRRHQLENDKSCSTSRLQGSRQTISEKLCPQSQTSTRGDLAVKTLSIAGSVASVVSLAKEFLEK